ncbi:MAG: response regulator [Alcanivoracaceae bacterium]|jgi:CheY-like chemotaxis protein|nr:response regulator [Alcanivoracaceae bacterium]
MIRQRILPFYHPTSVYLVDDNQRFLDNFLLQLDESLAVVAINSPAQALELIESQHLRPGLDQRCLSYIQSDAEQAMLRLDFALIEREISDARRFADISVVIVDYDMPEMTGLEFCSRITDPRIKKVLLTGVADEKIAVHAFNEGLIDAFLMKSDPEVIDKVSNTINDLQTRYFSEVSSLIQRTLTLKAPEVLSDPDFVDIFSSLCRKHRIVEYFYVDEPAGFLLVTDDGCLMRLVIADTGKLQRSAFALKGLHAPDHVLKDVTTGKAIPWLWIEPDEYDEDPFDWSDVLFPASPINTERSWFMALIQNPPADIEYDSGISSYSAFLEEMDSR